MRVRVVVWLGLALGVTGLGCAPATRHAAASSNEAATPVLKIQPTSASAEPAAVSVEIRDDAVTIAGEAVQNDMLSVRGALARHRGGASTANVSLVSPRPAVVDDVLAGAAATELKRLVLKLDAASIELLLVVNEPATHELRGSTDGRLHFRALTQTPASDDLATWLPGQPSEEEAARRTVIAQCIATPCRINLWRGTGQAAPLLWSFLESWQRMMPRTSPAQIALVYAGATGSKTRLGASAVSGRLPPEVIQRIVRHHFGMFRKCYEAGLGRNEHLTGRVIARFVIGRDGKVSNVADGGSDIPDSAVRECVLKAFYELEFPAPDGGIVTVVYPIMLAPG